MFSNNKTYNSAQDILNAGNGLSRLSQIILKCGLCLIAISIMFVGVLKMAGAFDHSDWLFWVICCAALGGLGVSFLSLAIICTLVAPIIAGIGIIGLDTKQIKDANTKQLKAFAAKTVDAAKTTPVSTTEETTKTTSVTNENCGEYWICGKCKTKNLCTRNDCWSCGNPK